MNANPFSENDSKGDIQYICDLLSVLFEKGFVMIDLHWEEFVCTFQLQLWV